MAFELKNVVPWGRNLEEYTNMFALTAHDLSKRIISFGDGPASFNLEMHRQGKEVTSLDPVYQFTADELRERIHETKDTIIRQMQENRDNFVWTSIKSIDELERIRMEAMASFLADFEKESSKSRYLYHELPAKTEFADQAFDLGLSSHFLILYAQLGLDFHLQSIREMLRLCKEVRIFPIVNLNAGKSEVLDGILETFGTDYELIVSKVNYEFQKGGNEMLTLRNHSV
ncbi:SAM-dependent methyltransferase [Rapidithrix thailandica]|uniref:SAM-dependent methyltransferase n=1 Tax=Rapidithrix thailandica TaxID=413964 RepID=A0AAW9SEB4_9BACT